MGLAEMAGKLSAAQKTALLGAAGREGARLSGLTSTETDELTGVRVLGRSGGLTSRGVALRAIVVREAFDDAFGPL